MKCPGAETLLRVVIDNDEGVRGAMRRQAWLNSQSAEYLNELADASQVLSQMAAQALEAKG